MKVIIVALGSAGDVHPNVGLALALQRRGHRVLLVAATVFGELARRVGLPFAGLGTEKDFYDTLKDPDIWHPYKAFFVLAKRLVHASMRDVYDIIKEHREPEGTLVVASGLTFGALVAHEKLGVPLATVQLQPAIFRSVHAPPVLAFPDLLGALPRALRPLYFRALDRFIIDPLLAGKLNEFRRELGLAPVRRVFDGWMHSSQLVVGFFPEWFGPPQADWPPTVHLTGFPLYDESDSRQVSPELTQFLDAGEAPVAFTAGSANAHAKDFFRVSVDACRQSGQRGILLTQFPEQLPESLPEGVRHFNYVPFSHVLPRAAAFVHHGGIGTTGQALAAGVPQLVVPWAHDQPDNAVRIRRLGVGDFLLPRNYKSKPAAERLSRLIGSPAVREECRRRKVDVTAAKPLDRTCELIEQLGGNKW